MNAYPHINLTFMLSLELILKKHPYWWRGRKTQLQKNPAIPCHVHAIHCKNEVIQRSQTHFGFNSLIIHRIASTYCATLQTIRHVFTQNSPVSRKSPLPSLQPHCKIQKYRKLMFWHTSIVHPVSLFLPKGYHVSRLAGWVVWVWGFFNNTVQKNHFPFRLSLFWYLTEIDAEALKDYFEWQVTRTLAYFFLQCRLFLV